MKHNIKITIILVLLFLLAQLVGLKIVDNYGDRDLPLGIERPEIEEDISYIPLMFAILIATGLALILVKFGAMKIWKIWFFIATLYLLTLSLGGFFEANIAFIIATDALPVLFVFATEEGVNDVKKSKPELPSFPTPSL